MFQNQNPHSRRRARGLRVRSPSSGGLLSGKAGPYQASRTLISFSFIFHPLICRKHAFADMDIVLAEAG